MTYTKQQLTWIRNNIDTLNNNEKIINKALAVMCPSSHMPFCDYHDPLGIINIIDPELWDILSYILYECQYATKDNPYIINCPNGKKVKIIWSDLKNFLLYAKVAGLWEWK